jgi:two-component system phosphate regulon sensor histidine kinase PhoR
MYRKRKINRRIKLAFWLIIVVMVIINVLQLYFFHTSYQEAKQKFQVYSSSSLFGAVMQYFKMKSGDSLSTPQYPIYVVSGSNQRVVVNNKSGNTIEMSANGSALNVDTLNPDYAHDYRQYQFVKDGLDRKLMDSLYEQFLSSKPIHTDYILDTFKSRGVAKDPQLTGRSMSQKARKDFPVKTNPIRIIGYSNVVIFAQLKYDYRFLAKELTWPFISSVLLLFFSNLIIIFIVRIIRKESRIAEMKNDFINNMTHELQTPITIAIAGLDAILQHHKIDDHNKLEKYVEVCKRQLNQLDNLVEKILSSANQTKATFVMHREQVSLTEMLQHIINNHLTIATKKVSFYLNSTEEIFIMADKTHLANAFNNLIDNAIKYSGNEVTIKIDIRRFVDTIRISIKDNGIGIPREYQSMIFDKFFRIPQGDSQNIKGFGLGLSYVKNVIERHDGFIGVSSSAKNGTEFSIYFPVK